MKITILGSGSSTAMPRAKCRCETCRDARKKNSKSERTRSSVFFEYKNRNVLIDCGPDFLQQIKLLPKGNKQNIDALLLTHAHIDACGGLKFLNALAKKQSIFIPIYALEKTFRKIKNLSKFDHLETIPIEPSEFFKEGDIKIIPIPVHHGMKTLNYPTLGFRVNNTIIASDCASVDRKYLKYFGKAKTLLLDGSMWFGTQIRGHFNVVNAIDFANKIHAKKVYLTHIGHSYPIHENAEKEIKKYALLKNKKMEVNLAYDGLKIY